MDYEKAYKAVLQTATQWIKDGCTDKEKICLECVFPELRESEDERIRKGLVKLLTVASEAYLVESTGIKKDSYLAYLEKQKEHQFCSDAPNESSWSGIISSSDKDKNLDEIAQDYVDGVKEYNPEPTWNLMQTAVCYGYHYREQKEQKPADRFKEAREKYQVEWSEEEESKMGIIIRLVEQNSGWPYRAIKEYVNWLKSLRPQPKVELSEDVKKTLDEVSHILIGLNYKQVAEDYKQAIEKLLSLRPQAKQEWDTHDMAIVNCIVCCLDGQFVPKAARKQALEWFNKHRRDFLNNPSWKPSKEQMKALEKAIIRVHSDDEIPILTELRQQLKKLM